MCRPHIYTSRQAKENILHIEHGKSLKSRRYVHSCGVQKFPWKHLPVLIFIAIYYLALSLFDTSTEAYAIQCHRMMMVINAGNDNSRRGVV